MDTHDRRPTGYSRRDFGKLALAAVPAASIWSALGGTGVSALEKINSTINGVTIGAITYSFRAIPAAEDVLKAYITIGLGEMEAQAVRSVGNDFSPVVSSVPAEDSATRRVTFVGDERAHRIAVIVDDDGVDRVRIPQPHRETRGRLRAAAGRREHRLETGPRDRRLLELERLGQGECRRRPRKEGEQQHRNRKARQASAILCFALAPEVVQYH